MTKKVVEEDFILWITIITSVLSSIGSIFIMFIFWKFKDLRKFPFTYVFCLAVADLFYALSNLIVVNYKNTTDL